MHWEKEIRIRITLRRIVGTILAASTVANLIIVGAVYGADSATPAPTETSATVTSLSTSTFSIPAAKTEATPGAASPHIPNLTLTYTPAGTSTDTPSVTPTATSTSTEVPMAGPSWTFCIKKFYWPTYRVKAGDTLFSLAFAASSTVQELLSANCLENSRIYTGQVLYVRRPIVNPITSTVTATGTPSPTPTASASYTMTATHTATDTVTSTYTPTDTPTYTPTVTSSYTPLPTVTPTFTAPPSVTPTGTELFSVPDIQPEFQDLNGLICAYPKSVSLMVSVYDPDGIQSVHAWLYTKDDLHVAAIPMEPFGNIYTVTNATLPDPFYVNEVDHYAFWAIDNFGNTSLSPVYNKRSGGCWEPRGFRPQNGGSH